MERGLSAIRAAADDELKAECAAGGRAVASRRGFLAGAAALALGVRHAPAADDWNAGRLAHLIPAASHDRLLIKTSFEAPLDDAPRLLIDGRRVAAGFRTDGRGRFWRFAAAGLAPATTYTLRIADAGGAPLCDPWPLTTLPAPGAPAESLRILAFTCGGGVDGIRLGERSLFLDMAARRRLLARGLALRPDVVISNGDMIYWDLATALNKGEALAKVARATWAKVGEIDFSRAMLGTDNEAVLTRIADRQIADLYGTSLRSVPSFFLPDDHDLFENDEATAALVTLPPTPDRLAAARAIQSLYYPEFLPDANRPRGLTGKGAAGRSADLSESFGTLRYGTLLEAVLYDTKRHATIAGDEAGMVPGDAEQWLLARTAADDTRHFFHVPSTPFGWSAGKFGEWYPDVVGAGGTLGTAGAKPFWPAGWWRQHQRLVAALAAQTQRIPLAVQGDLHAVGYGLLRRSGAGDLGANPVHLVLTGPLGTGDLGFPSAYRGTKAQPSSLLAVEEAMPPMEKNGFAIIDLTPEQVRLRLFAWRPPDRVQQIDDLEPTFSVELSRQC
jgi:hypothetical protein